MGETDEEDVEVERMPNLDGWEYFKALDGAEERERWTLAIRHARDQRLIEYALWLDPKKDPEATGTLDVLGESRERWAEAVRDAVESSKDGGLDDGARAEVVCAILRQHDATLEKYEDRLVFSLEASRDDNEDDRDEDEDSEDEDDDDENDDEDD